MFTITARAALGAIRSTADALAVPLPRPIVEAIAAATELPATESVDRAQIADAFVDAQRAGADPYTDPTVQRLLAVHALAQINFGEELRTKADQLVVAAFGQHAEAILDGWRKAVAADAQVLAESYAVVGPIDLDDVAALPRLSPDHAAAWAAARSAADRIGQVSVGWTHLASLTRFAPVDPARSLLRVCEPTLAQWRSIPRKAGAWELVCNGLTVELADGPMYRARSASIDDQIRAEAQSAEDAMLDSLRTLPVAPKSGSVA